MGKTRAHYDYQKMGRLTFFDEESHETLLLTHPVVLFDDFLHPATRASSSVQNQRSPEDSTICVFS